MIPGQPLVDWRETVPLCQLMLVDQLEPVATLFDQHPVVGHQHHRTRKLPQRCRQFFFTRHI